MNSLDTKGGFNLPNKIDDSLMPEPEEPEREESQQFEYSGQPPYMMYPQPQFQFSPPKGEKQSTSFFNDGDNKMYFIILFIAFILGFFMGKTMQPIIIRST